MSITTEYENLGIPADNQSTLIARHVEMVPPTMMPRELLQNCLEALPDEAHNESIREVQVSFRMLDWASGYFPSVDPKDATTSVRKLIFRNTGQGMDAQELSQALQWSSSACKKLGIDANFGVGAKMTGLKVSPMGLVYRSCKNGTVAEAVIRRREDTGAYALLRLPVADDPHGRSVRDVTDFCLEDGEDISSDWTEVTLLGHSYDQDTFLSPYGDSLPQPLNWAETYFSNRYFRTPSHAEIKLFSEDSAGVVSSTLFTGVSHLIPDYDAGVRGARYTKVEIIEGEFAGTVVHYLGEPFNPNKPGQLNPISGMPTCGALVFKNEMFDVHRGSVSIPKAPKPWTQTALSCGILFAAKFVSVFVEVPDTGMVFMNDQRSHLQFKQGDNAVVDFSEFAAVVEANIPDWLAEMNEALAPNIDKKVEESYDRQMREFIKDLKQQESIEPTVNGDQSGAEFDGRKFPEGPPTPSVEPPTPQKKRVITPHVPGPRLGKSCERPLAQPQVFLIDDPAQLAEKGMTDFAAVYEPATNDLFVNALFAAYMGLRAEMSETFSPYCEAEGERLPLIKSKLDANYETHIAKSVVLGISNVNKPGWGADMVFHQLLSPQALTIKAGDNAWVRDISHRQLKTVFSQMKKDKTKVIDLPKGGKRKAKAA